MEGQTISSILELMMAPIVTHVGALTGFPANSINLGHQDRNPARSALVLSNAAVAVM